jgi:hypothetical protein
VRRYVPSFSLSVSLSSFLCCHLCLCLCGQHLSLELLLVGKGLALSGLTLHRFVHSSNTWCTFSAYFSLQG